jgi:hypothetical protein
MRLKAGYTDEPVLSVLDMSQSSAMNTTLNGLVGSGIGAAGVSGID